MDRNMLSDNIAALRKRYGLTQAKVAAHLGISRSAYAMYETGDREVPVEKLRLLSDLFGIDMRQMMDTDLRHSAQLQKELASTLAEHDREELSRMTHPQLLEYCLAMVMQNKKLKAENASYRSAIRAIQEIGRKAPRHTD